PITVLDSLSLHDALPICTGFANGLEVAVQLHRSCAVAIAEHAAMHFASKLRHLGAFVLGGQPLRLVVKRLHLLTDLEVLVGDGADRKSTRLNSSHRTISY